MAQKYIPVPLRRLVRARASERCEHCLIPERLTLAPHWVDHTVAEKHGGKAEEGNLALACALCNQRKGSDLASIDPESGQLVALFHPRLDRWTDHFRLAQALLEPLTAVGRVTIRLLHLNQPHRLEHREPLLRVGVRPFPRRRAAGRLLNRQGRR